MGIRDLYTHSLALLTDLYELTMAYGYWKLGVMNKEAVFSLFYRHNPFHSGFCVACGLHEVIEFIQQFHYDESDLAYLATLKGNDGRPLFTKEFLDYLGELRLTCDIDAVPEGTLVFPLEPLVRVQGPFLQCQLLETALLTITNFSTLIATKAARVCLAAEGEPVAEFGLRRAQGIDGGITASRASYVGGCTSTSNVMAGKLYGIPVSGTHAHSWVMSFDSEVEAFAAYADVLPNNCVFLVDTYNTLEGVRHAVQIGKRMRAQGHEMIGIRLDSGDLAYLSIEARKILDAGGFTKAKIVGSNQLDEYLIESLKEQGAQINVWGVGTKLATAYDHPALGGVYKLAAIREPGEAWQHKIKLSEQVIKINIPGAVQVRRFYRDDGMLMADMLYDELLGAGHDHLIIDPADETRRKPIPPDAPYTDVLAPVFRGGELVYHEPSLSDSRAHTLQQLSLLHPTIKRQVNPHEYPVGLERQLFDLRLQLILKARGFSSPVDE